MSTGADYIIQHLRAMAKNGVVTYWKLDPRDVVAILAAIDKRDAEIERLEKQIQLFVGAARRYGPPPKSGPRRA